MINPLILPLIGIRAYLDPGSGSFILQILIATLVGSLFLIKVYWKKITSFFKRTPAKDQEVTEVQEQDQKQEQ